MRIPKKITPCPISEAVVELRFKSDLPPGAVFGVVYSAFSKTYSKPEDLPILQIPEFIRTRDPNFKYKPYYKLAYKDFILQIGPDVATLSNVNEYAGWTIFSKELKHFIDTIDDIGVVNYYERFGLRYINYFDFDIFPKLNIRILQGEKNFSGKEIGIRTVIEGGGFNSNVQIANNATISIGEKRQTGSIIDVDVSRIIDRDEMIDIWKSCLEPGHKQEKKLFFGFLNDDYLSELNPEY